LRQTACTQGSLFGSGSGGGILGRISDTLKPSQTWSPRSPSRPGRLTISCAILRRTARKQVCPRRQAGAAEGCQRLSGQRLPDQPALPQHGEKSLPRPIKPARLSRRQGLSWRHPDMGRVVAFEASAGKAFPDASIRPADPLRSDRSGYRS
jgi:hypothetical protein